MWAYLVVAFILGWLVSKASSPRRTTVPTVPTAQVAEPPIEVVTELDKPAIPYVSRFDKDGWPITPDTARSAVGNDSPYADLPHRQATSSGSPLQKDDCHTNSSWAVEGTSPTPDGGLTDGEWVWDDRRQANAGPSTSYHTSHWDDNRTRTKRPKSASKDVHVKRGASQTSRNGTPAIELCEFCVRPFTAKALPNHIRQVHSGIPPAPRGVPPGPPTSCEVCQVTMSSKADLRKHKNADHPWSILCTQCLQTFSDGWQALDHYRNYHDAGHVGFDGIQAFLDTLRGSSALRAETPPDRPAKYGTALHSDGTPQSFICLKCWNPFPDRSAFNEHVASSGSCDVMTQAASTDSGRSFPALPSAVQLVQMELTSSQTSNGSSAFGLVRRNSSKEGVASIYPESEVPEAYTPDVLQRGARLSDLRGVRVYSSSSSKSARNGAHGAIGRPPSAAYLPHRAGPPLLVPSPQRSYYAIAHSDSSDQKPYLPHDAAVRSGRPPVFQPRSPTGLMQSERTGRSPGQYRLTPLDSPFVSTPPPQDEDWGIIISENEDLPSFIFPSGPGKFSAFGTESDEHEMPNAPSDSSAPPPAPVPAPASASAQGHSQSPGGASEQSGHMDMGPKPAPIRGGISVWSTPLPPLSPTGRAPMTPRPCTLLAPRSQSTWDRYHPSNDPPPPRPITRVTNQVTLADIARRPKSSARPVKVKKQSGPARPHALEPRFDGDDWQIYETPRAPRGQGGMKKTTDEWGMAWGTQPQGEADYGGW